MAMRESYEGGASVLCDRILHGSISLNLQIKSMLTRTVRTPQYLFGVKQIARLIAVMMSVGANVVSKPVHLLEIWVQESKRIYGSVIESVEDSTKLDDAVHHACDMNMLNTSGDVEKRVEIDHADGLLKYHANDGEEAVAVWMAVSNFPSSQEKYYPSYSETSAKVAQNALQFYSDGNNDKLGDPTFVKDAVAAFFADTHVTLLDMNKDADALEIVQPSDIIVAVQRFASVVKRRGMELKEQITKNVTAHCRFRFMCEVIPFVQEELDTAGKDLQTKTAIYDESNRYFVQESKKLEEIIQILKNSSEIVEASQQDVSRIEHELHTAWESAQPIQIEAQTQLDRIPKKDVTELKSGEKTLNVPCSK
eukprot:g7144.t1